MERYGVEGAVTVAQRAAVRAHEHAGHLSRLLTRTAAALEQTARLADEHAERRESSGQPDDAAHERELAVRARLAAHRAQSQAARWGELADDPAVGDATDH